MSSKFQEIYERDKFLIMGSPVANLVGKTIKRATSMHGDLEGPLQVIGVATREEYIKQWGSEDASNRPYYYRVQAE